MVVNDVEALERHIVSPCHLLLHELFTRPAGVLEHVSIGYSSIPARSDEVAHIIAGIDILLVAMGAT